MLTIAIDRLVSVVPITGCWMWMRAIDIRGYGRMKIRGKWVLAHRLMYQSLVGPLDSSLVLDHLCRNRWCVNPAHLEQVTHRTNILRGVGSSARCASATKCVNGHEFDQANTYQRPTGGRRCRACGRSTSAVYMARVRSGGRRG